MTRNRDPESLEGRELVDAVTADSERAEQGLRRGNLMVAVVGIGFVAALVAGGVLFNRLYPPPSPPNTATQQELTKLRADLDQYLAGRGGLRDQQYAKTVYTLCELARDTGNTSVLDDYDCDAVLTAPSPSVSSAPPVTGTATPRSTPSTAPSPTSSASPSTSASVVEPPAASTGTGAGPTVATPTRTRNPTPAATPSSVLSIGVDLCNLPILTLCSGGTP